MTTTTISERIKEAVDITDLISFYGYDINRSGFMCCPFHGERTASLKVYKKNNSWYCFGCHRGGSVIDFVMEMLHCSAGTAIDVINRDFGLNIERDDRDGLARYLFAKKMKKYNQAADDAEYQKAKAFAASASEWSDELADALDIITRYETAFENRGDSADG